MQHLKTLGKHGAMMTADADIQAESLVDWQELS
jgi:hypothetical protein